MKIMPALGLFFREITIMVRSPVFITLTLVGNLLVGSAGATFYLLENGQNPQLQHFIDAVWWSYATATTTGYGAITPVTHAGKVLGIFLMLLGTALFAMFAGLFAEIILTARKKHGRN